MEPTEDDYIASANRHHGALVYLMKEAEHYPEWVATTAFYKAVQIAEAMFAATPDLPSSHDHVGRLETLRLPRFRSILPHYKTLLAASIAARYLGGSRGVPPVRSFDAYIPPEQVVAKLIRDRLRPLEQNALPFLSDAGRPALVTLDRDADVTLPK